MAEIVQSKTESNLPTQLDHIIILLSPKEFNNVPSWLSDNFTIIEGGTHSKGTSQNKLIIFKDGTYLELFSWTDPQPEGIPAHSDFPSWASKPEGCIIDWALTGPDADITYQQVRDNLQKLNEGGESHNITYDAPKEGGRRRKDDKELRWATTRPKPTSSSQPSIDVPFFCHDITPRVLRVPNRPEGDTKSFSEITQHPCGASGVAGLVIEVAAPALERATKLYEAILGGAPANRREGAAWFNIPVPDRDEKWGGKSWPCSLHLQVPDDDHRFSLSMPGTSIRRLVLRTEMRDRKGDELEREGFGTYINLC